MNASPRRVAVLLAALALAAVSGAHAQAPDERAGEEVGVSGRWSGPASFPGGITLRIVFNIERAADGTLTATAESPDQGGEPFPVSAIERTGDSLHVEIAVVRASFEGKIGAEERAITGTFRQGAAAVPLTLRRVEAGAEPESTGAAPNRPQEPEPPFPYETEDVTFPGGGGVTLAGTLTLPAPDASGEGSGTELHPAVVLVSGSGPQNRDSEVFGHKPFLVLADYLTRRGIAVLRYDERGVGASTGNYRAAGLRDFAADASGAVALLRGRDDVGAVGLVGHSEGGVVAPMVATQDTDGGAGAPADFLVLLAGPGVPGEAVLYEQAQRALEVSGATQAQIERQRALQERLFTALTEAPDSARAAERFREIAEEEGMDRQEAEARAAVRTRPAFRDFLTYDPATALRRLDVSVLALFGEKDFQVTPGQNAAPVREALAANADATVRVMPGLNHLFQPAETGLTDEYSQIEETFAPAALDVIGDWIVEHTRAPSAAE